MDWHPHPGLPATHKVLAVSTKTLQLSQDCLGQPCDWSGALKALTKAQNNNYRPHDTSLCINQAGLLLKAHLYFENIPNEVFLHFISSLKGFNPSFHHLPSPRQSPSEQHVKGKKLTRLRNTAADKRETLHSVNMCSSCKGQLWQQKRHLDFIYFIKVVVTQEC